MRITYPLVTALILCSCTHVIQGEHATWLEERWAGVEPQELDNSCGLASVLTIMRNHYGDHRFDERRLLGAYINRASDEQLKKALSDGISLAEIEVLVQSLGYKTARKVLTFAELETIVRFVPVLVYLEIGTSRHFAVVRGINKEVVWLADPARGNVYHSHGEFLSEWRVPKTLGDGRSQSGGLIIIGQGSGKLALSFLKEPRAGFPAAFLDIRRQMIFGR